MSYHKQAGTLSIPFTECISELITILISSHDNFSEKEVKVKHAGN